MKNLKISVIIPTHNAEKFIVRTINSVLNQTYKDYELIIVDDASEDNTIATIRTRFPKIRISRLKKNLGQAGARNRGIERAKGEYIAFLDHDDEWLPDYLEKQVKSLDSAPKAVLSYTGAYILDEKARCIGKHLKGIGSKDPAADILLNIPILTMSSTLIKRDALLKAGMLDERLELGEDQEIYVRLLKYGKIITCRALLLKKHQHSSNTSRAENLFIEKCLKMADIFFSENREYNYLETRFRTRYLIEAIKGQTSAKVLVKELKAAFNLSIPLAAKEVLLMFVWAFRYTVGRTGLITKKYSPSLYDIFQ